VIVALTAAVICSTASSGQAEATTAVIVATRQSRHATTPAASSWPTGQ
jgi:hypothetical protein